MLTQTNLGANINIEYESDRIHFIKDKPASDFNSFEIPNPPTTNSYTIEMPHEDIVKINNWFEKGIENFVVVGRQGYIDWQTGDDITYYHFDRIIESVSTGSSKCTGCGHFKVYHPML